MRRSGSAITLALLAVLGGCAQPPDGEEAAHTLATAASFTCCESADIDPVRHPGETFQLHWIMTLTPAPKGTPIQQIVLRASLSDGYPSVQQLKNAETDASAIAASDSITTSTAATIAPVTDITIPETAATGYYNLSTSIDTEGAILRGSSLIRVEAEQADEPADPSP